MKQFNRTKITFLFKLKLAFKLLFADEYFLVLADKNGSDVNFNFENLDEVLEITSQSVDITKKIDDLLK